MSEILVKYDEAFQASNGERYFAQAVTRQREDRLWEGWLEFLPASGDEETIASDRETTQPNKTDVEYWAQGLTRVYLEGALSRALSTAENTDALDTAAESGATERPSTLRGPGGSARSSVRPRPILDPYSVYMQGEDILRSELAALSHSHVESIVDSYGFAPGNAPADLSTIPQESLIESIVEGVRANRL